MHQLGQDVTTAQGACRPITQIDRASWQTACEAHRATMIARRLGSALGFGTDYPRRRLTFAVARVWARRSSRDAG